MNRPARSAPLSAAMWVAHREALPGRSRHLLDPGKPPTFRPIREWGLEIRSSDRADRP